MRKTLSCCTAQSCCTYHFHIHTQPVVLRGKATRSVEPNRGKWIGVFWIYPLQQDEMVVESGGGHCLDVVQAGKPASAGGGIITLRERSCWFMVSWKRVYFDFLFVRRGCVRHVMWWPIVCSDLACITNWQCDWLFVVSICNRIMVCHEGKNGEWMIWV